MKKFDLEKALAGEPVVLRNGDKAFVKFVLENPVREECAMIGYVIDDRGRDSLIGWYKNGLYASCGGDGLDIVGMYEEPRPTVTLTLPCPLKSVTVGQRVFYLDLNKQCERICAFLFQKDSTYHFNLLKNGGIFSTEEDAQAWLDAMKNARR
ncbi:TPA: pyruvate kinase [Pasteurella multocida]|uniref:pyruvate kinase n=1 Tax=Pasteurella multocida TaxID=747 RepID=UPI0023417936|nr:pyruvate kinase [Pasteurella multocida]MDC4238418.1 pyruvate kinase [Pasteurella multocida]HDR1056972.1 pyruvate kinase [Pasteurella multocida]HDR1065107.1 pyruvate kinase [Pasteurella multocida]